MQFGQLLLVQVGLLVDSRLVAELKEEGKVVRWRSSKGGGGGGMS